MNANLEQIGTHTLLKPEQNFTIILIYFTLFKLCSVSLEY